MRLKRVAFLASSSAAFLSACAHRGASVLPPLSPSSNGHAAAAHAALGTPAAPIPANVLAHPIIGEARRFDGLEAPPGWLLMEGQTLPVAQYPRLFAIYGNGARNGTTFTVAKPLQGWIIAAAGLYPNSVKALESLHRGADSNHGVSVAGIVVLERPFTLTTARAPAPRVETWYPGTMPTEEQLANHAATSSGR